MGYTNKDFLDAYCKKRGLRIREGCDESIGVLMPFVMMDIAYEYYTKNIQKFPAKQWAKKCKVYWAEAYKEFNDFLFNCYDTDMQDAFCDKMDKFKRFIYGDIVALQTKMLRCLPTKSTPEKRQVIAAAMLSNRITKLAADWWFDIYTKTVWIQDIHGKMVPHRENTQNNGLNGCLTWSKNFAVELMKVDPDFEEDMAEEDEAALWAAIEDLKPKVIKFTAFDLNT